MRDEVNAPRTESSLSSVESAPSIGIVLECDRPLSTFPSICNSVELLEKSEFSVSLFILDSMNVDIRLSGTQVSRFKRLRLLGWRQLSWLGSVVSIFLTLCRHGRNLHFLWATQGTELIAVALYCFVKRIPYAHFCLEIDAKANRRPFRIGIYRSVTSLAVRGATFVVVQDEVRREMFRSAYHAHNARFFLVPNSYVGSRNERTDFLRSKYGFDRADTVVLYAGGIERWALSEKFFSGLAHWPKELKLVLHGWSRDGFLEQMQAHINTANGDGANVFVSSDFLSEEQYSHMVSSADVGIVWYRSDVGDNVLKIGLSSGKLAMFLRCGIPVVVPDYVEGLNEYVEKFGFGELAHDEQLIPTAVQSIRANREVYSQKASAFFSSHLDFEKCFAPVLEAMRIETSRRTRKQSIIL